MNKDKLYNDLIGKKYFGWEVLKAFPKDEKVLCLRIEENNYENFKIGEKSYIYIDYFILKYINEQQSKHKTLPKELFLILKSKS